MGQPPPFAAARLRQVAAKSAAEVKVRGRDGTLFLVLVSGPD